ncbi:hypothetical protein V8G54_012071 [Vigna mungo]|uniref:Uncharacterized protein n=1 Tax=Vigna mungo TaxID=3915 RepID=A0AAQ3NQF1_VIGMU
MKSFHGSVKENKPCTSQYLEQGRLTAEVKGLQNWQNMTLGQKALIPTITDQVPNNDGSGMPLINKETRKKLQESIKKTVVFIFVDCLKRLLKGLKTAGEGTSYFCSSLLYAYILIRGLERCFIFFRGDTGCRQMASSSSSKRTKIVPPSKRNDTPSGWISDSDARERFLCWKKVKDVVPHKSIELSLFRNERFIFPKKFRFQRLYTFVQMKGDCYPNPVEVFYNNIKVADGNIHSRVKGVDIVINNDTWLEVVGLKDEGRMSHLPKCLQNRWTWKTHMFKDCMRYPGRYKKEKGFLHSWMDKEEKIIAYIIGHVLLPGRSNYEKLTLEDVYLLNARVAVFTWHIIDVTCSKANQIGKATLTCIGLKKTALGWIFTNKQDSTKNQDELPDSDSEQILPSLMFEFQKFVANRFEKVSKRASLMKKSLIYMNEKMDESINNYVESSTSIEESTDEDDETSEEDFVESSETE